MCFVNMRLINYFYIFSRDCEICHDKVANLQGHAKRVHGCKISELRQQPKKEKMQIFKDFLKNQRHLADKTVSTYARNLEMIIQHGCGGEVAQLFNPIQWDQWWVKDGFFFTLEEEAQATTVATYLHSIKAYTQYKKIYSPQSMNVILQLEARLEMYEHDGF